MIITRGLGWEAMGTDGTGINFDITNDLTIKTKIENKLDDVVCINIDCDLVCIKMNDIDIQINVGD